jgi:transposase-like protein
LDALRQNNIAELARKYGLNANLLYLWRDQLIERRALDLLGDREAEW